jgi:hypothetical protein
VVSGRVCIKTVFLERKKVLMAEKSDISFVRTLVPFFVFRN